MKEPVTKLALWHIVRNGTVHPHIIFTITAQEVADLSHKTPQIRPSLVIADPDAPETMTITGPSGLFPGDAGFKVEKDITLAYLIFARRAKKHNHTVKVWAWNGASEDDNEFVEEKGGHPHATFFFAPREFRKNYQQSAAAAAQKFYQRILSQTDIGEKTDSGRTIVKIFTSP